MPIEHEVAPKERKETGRKNRTKQKTLTCTLFPKVSECALTILLFFLEQKNSSICLWLLKTLWASLVAQMVQCRRSGFNPWVGKIPWRRKWQPTPVFLPGKSHGPRSLVGYCPWDRKESDMTERLHFHFHFCNLGTFCILFSSDCCG